jgi:hypothetical protein
MRIGDLLVDAGAITQEQLHEALRQQSRLGGRLGSNLVELGFIDERRLAAVLAEQLKIPSASAGTLDKIAPEVLRLVPAPVAERLRVLPLREDAGKLWIAMADPTDKEALDELARVTKRPVRPMVAPELLVQYALEKYYQVARRPRILEVRSGGSALLRIEDGTRTAPIVDPDAEAEEAPVYQPGVSGDGSVALDAATGFIDEAPAPSLPAPALLSPTSLSQLWRGLAEATSDDAVFDLALSYLHPDVQRLLVLLLRKGHLVAYRARGVELAPLEALRVALDEAPLVARTLSGGDAYVGRVPAPSLGPIAAPLGLFAEALGVVLPLRLGKHAVGCIVGLDPSLALMRRKPELDKISLKIDRALHIGYLRRQILEP